MKTLITCGIATWLTMLGRSTSAAALPYRQSHFGSEVGQDSRTIELMWVQDFSSSFQDDLMFLQEDLVPIFEELMTVFNHSRYGVAGFVDKPLEPFGYKESADYCYRLRYPLTRYSERLQETMDKAVAHSGHDWKENQLEAIINAVTSKESRWSNESVTPDGYKVQKVVVLATDSGYHKAGDGPKSLLEHPDGFVDNENCTKYDYPSVAQVKRVLLKHNVLPIFLVTQDLLPVYRDLVQKLGDRGIVYVLDPSSLNIRDALAISLNAALIGSASTCLGPDCCYGPGCCNGHKCLEEPVNVRIVVDQKPKSVKFVVEY